LAPAERALRAGLRRARARWFRAVVLSVGWKVALGAALSLAFGALADRLGHPHGVPLVILCGVVLLTMMASTVVLVWPYRRRPDDRRLARFIEERCPDCEDEVVAAIDATERGDATGFAVLVIERAAARLRDLDLTRLVPAEELRSDVVRFAAAAVALIVAAAVTLPLFLRARVEARGPGERRDPHAFATAAAPAIEAIDLHYEYPGFTRLAPRDELDGGDIYAPAGTRVRLRVRADAPIATAHVALGSGSLPATRIDARTFESTLTLARDGSYRASVQDARGLRGDSVEYFIRVTTDRPPEIHIVRPAGDQEVTPLEEVTIEAKAEDDFGIASMDLVFAIAGGPEHVVPFQAVSGTGTARVGTRLLAAEELGVKPGDVISYYARARDVPHAKPSTLSHSGISFLEVKPFNEEYSLAESQAMAAATGTELAGLISAQKQVISATWNLQRRVEAGRSSDDVRAIAAAQAEVKARTERAAGFPRPFRRGGGVFFQFSGEPQTTSGADNIGAAAAAMGRAIGHLSAGATNDAISPEMAALSALLKAEAEIRQRQIAQQSSGASTFGNGRQGQDLSNLFDRELKRQQRTNYETGSHAEQAPERDAASALDRIKDLAHRQEDLAQRQHGADGMPEEQRRRELERLTREQETLQQQLEQAAREQRSDASGAPGRPSDGDAQSALQHALEDMRRASSDLRRHDAAAAASKAGAAAEQLRNAEARMESGESPADRASGETRELADALDSLRKARDALSQRQRRLADLQRASGGRGRQGTDGGELKRAQEEYARAVQRARDMMGTQPLGGRDTSGAASTPEGHEWSWGAPGTEAWKQDFSKWEALGNGVARALERSEASVAARLSKALLRDRLRAGGSERVPDGYADRVARYYRSLALVKKQ
jgi:hypothetical protein